MTELERKLHNFRQKPAQSSGYVNDDATVPQIILCLSIGAPPLERNIHPMTRTFCRFTYIASWHLYVLAHLLLLGFAQQAFSQSLPPLHTINVPDFSIPFEAGSEEKAKTIKEVELLVSKDRGKHWDSVARQPLESKKFAFRADSDGEYWFAFRTTSFSGNSSLTQGQPDLRVMVNTKDPASVTLMQHNTPQGTQQSTQQSETGPLTPPRPVRFRDRNEAPLSPSVSAGGGKIASQNAGELSLPDRPNRPTPSKGGELLESTISGVSPEKISIPKSDRMIGPRFPGFESFEAENNCAEDTFDTFLSEMSSFLDVQPVATKAARTHQEAAATPNTLPPKSLADIPVGGITGIVLNKNNVAATPQIVVTWNAGQESWTDAQIDILRSSEKEGPRIPIAINLPNNGEYWWFLSPEDLKPFYITVQIRSLYGVRTDVTQDCIRIDSRLAQFQRP